MDELPIERATWGYCTVIIKHTSSLCCQGNLWLVFFQIAQHVSQGLPVRSLWCTLLVHLSKHAPCKKSWLASIPAGSLLLLPSSPCSSVLQLIRSQASLRSPPWKFALLCFLEWVLMVFGWILKKKVLTGILPNLHLYYNLAVIQLAALFVVVFVFHVNLMFILF